jgi:hypothetical protein
MEQEDWIEADRALDTFKRDVESWVFNDLNAAGDAVQHQPTIYHYTDASGALEILRTGRLWFTERAHLNDPVEVQYGLNVGHELFETAANLRGEAVPKDASLHLKGEHTFGLGANGSWTFCSSLYCNDLSQWRDYADDGRGVCLGFSIDNFDMVKLATLLPNVPNSLRFLVNYDRSHLYARMGRYVDRCLDILESADVASRESYYKPYGRALLYERDAFHVLNYGLFSNSTRSRILTLAKGNIVF